MGHPHITSLMAPVVFLLTILLTVANAAPHETSNEKGQKWVVLVAGANHYFNYFAQADTCHAYHMLRKGGIPANNIIHLNYDDVAHSPENPFQNNLINKVNGTNVYPGCEIDYRGAEVTPELFQNVLTGDKKAVKELIGREGKVLESTDADNVFLAMTDHGAPGIFSFPNSAKLHALDLLATLKEMNVAKKYKNMLVYTESCYSGSMYNGLLKDDLNIYAVTATSPFQPGYMCCYDNLRKVCLGTLFFNAFTFGVDKADRDTMTLKELFQIETDACTKNPPLTSNPQEYGNKSMNQMVLSEFMGSAKGNGHSEESEDNDQHIPEFQEPIPIDMAEIVILKRRLRTESLTYQQRCELKQKLDMSLTMKAFAEELFKDMAEMVVTEDTKVSPDHFLSSQEDIKNPTCYKQALRLLSTECPAMEMRKYPFIGRNFQVLINTCNLLDSNVIYGAIKKVTSMKKECQRITY